jgi:hypothetical protein
VTPGYRGDVRVATALVCADGRWPGRPQGETNCAIATALSISPFCVSKWMTRQREIGSVAPAQIGGYKPRTLSGECAGWLRIRIG